MLKKPRDLEKLRAQIDSVDRVILSALARRDSLARSIGEYKREHNLNPLDRKRRNELRNAWTKMGKSMQLPVGFVSDIYERIHKYSISVEKSISATKPRRRS